MSWVGRAIGALEAALLAAGALLCAASGAMASDLAALGRDGVRLMQEARVPGGAVAIVDGGEVVFEQAFGVRSLKSGEPVTPETVFPLASVSKTFAGTLAADLIVAGKLDPNQPVRQLNPSFRLRQPGQADAITLEHALSHASGLVPNAYDNLIEAGQSLDVILPKFSRIRPVCRPGRCYGYQNIVFSLVEPAVVSAAGESYADLIAHKYFEPLEMITASTGYEGFRLSVNKAYPHATARRSRTFQQVRHSKDYYTVLPAAGVNASLRDMARWLVAHMGHRPEVIAPDVVALATEKRTRTKKETQRRFWRGHLKDAHYGLGWRIYDFDGEHLIFHGGGLHGYRTGIGYAPALGIGIVVLTNGESGASSRMLAEFWTEVTKGRSQSVAAR